MRKDQNELKMPQKRPRHLNGGLSDANILHADTGDNARYIRLARAPINLPPIDLADPKQVEDRINMYFDYCIENDLKPGFMAMCNWLGASRSAVSRWKKGDYRASTHSDIIQKAVSQLEAIWEQYMIDGKINIVAGIFIGKQYYGATDKQEIAILADENSTAPMTPEEIAARLPDPDYSVE